MNSTVALPIAASAEKNQPMERLSNYTNRLIRQRKDILQRAAAVYPAWPAIVAGGRCFNNSEGYWRNAVNEATPLVLDEIEAALAPLEARTQRARAFAADCEYQQQCRESDRAAFQAHQDELLARRIGASPTAITVRVRLR